MGTNSSVVEVTRATATRNFSLPLFLVGGAAALAKIYVANTSGAATFLVPLGMALFTGVWRPSLLGRFGGCVGWASGVTFGWLILDGTVWIDGAVLYGFLLAFCPHALASLTRRRTVGDKGAARRGVHPTGD